MLYEQNVQINEAVVIDRIVFNVESEDLYIDIHFLVEIAVQSLTSAIANNIHEMAQVGQLVVEEGQSSLIGPNTINLTRLVLQTKSADKLCIRVQNGPVHGTVLKRGMLVPLGQCISFSAFINGSVFYMHDHSNSFRDQIQFEVMLTDGVTVSLLNLTVPIQISPGKHSHC